MRPIIKVENIGKQYRIGTSGPAYVTLRETIMQWLKFQTRPPANSFWALRNMSFQALPGEVIGVIGRNGAGKSTLLKIFSRITEPTEGRVELYGRVGSLLEVGTGFHPELTGRENVFLNGAILGMRRAETLKKFDDIVSFAEVERFIDTPVKRYSSGMYLRLAFAVAAFLESEILLVDEVLAVGDANFQKKCLGKMREVSASGHTVLLVSHNMAAVEGLCDRCLYISGGQLVEDGSPHDVIPKYLAADSAPESATRDLRRHAGRRAGLAARVTKISIRDSSGKPASAIRMGAGMTVEVLFDCDSHRVRPNLELLIKNSYVPVFTASTRLQKQFQVLKAIQTGKITCDLQDLPLLPGTYSIDVYFGDEYENNDVVYDAISFDITPADVFSSGEIPRATQGTIFWPGNFNIMDTETERVPD